MIVVHLLRDRGLAGPGERGFIGTRARCTLLTPDWLADPAVLVHRARWTRALQVVAEWQMCGNLEGRPSGMLRGRRGGELESAQVDREYPHADFWCE